MKNVIKLDNVTKRYGKNPALRDVSIEILPGKIIGLLGPNGSGKTTLLKLLLHIIRPNEGAISINDEEISYLTRKYISYMPDREYLYDTMTVKEAIEYYVDMFSDFDYDKAMDFCKKLDLDQSELLTKLSKGTKEKVSLMLTLSRKSAIYLLDEPLGSLDPVVKHQMLSVIKESKRDDAVILIATHLIKDTSDILDSIIFLKNGKIEVQTDVKDLKDKTIEEYYLEVFTNV